MTAHLDQLVRATADLIDAATLSQATGWLLRDEPGRGHVGAVLVVPRDVSPSDVALTIARKVDGALIVDASVYRESRTLLVQVRGEPIPKAVDRVIRVHQTRAQARVLTLGRLTNIAAQLACMERGRLSPEDATRIRGARNLLSEVVDGLRAEVRDRKLRRAMAALDSEAARQGVSIRDLVDALRADGVGGGPDA